MVNRIAASRLQVARATAALFVARGVAATSGTEIAKAAGISERTVWRYFRNKESCVAPLFALSWHRFSDGLRRWPREVSLETHLVDCFDAGGMSAQQIQDGLLIARMIAMLDDEPDLRSVWLNAYHDGEAVLAGIIGDRLGRSCDDPDVRLGAAAAMAAVRVTDHTISLAVIRHGQKFTTPAIASRLAGAIRTVSNLPFCDPVAMPAPQVCPAQDPKEETHAHTGS